jgi:ubiquinone biosynthesis protein
VSSNRSGVSSFAEKIVQGPEGFRRLLERLGPIFIKIGQFLALRPDLIPQEYCDELMELFDRVPPFPWSEARAILEEELGGSISEAFAYIDPTPLAAGSLAQTHYAQLADGAQVAVKIQRPGVREQIARDLRKARLIVRLLELSGVSFITAPGETLKEVSSWMEQEVDFRRELSNLTRLYTIVSDSREKIPRPYPTLSTARVLTAEFIEGVRFSELLPSAGVDRLRALGELRNSSSDLQSLAENLLLTSLTQIFRYHFFHADVHPGNLIALPRNVIGFVDFGLCDELDAAVRERQMRYLYAAYTDNTEAMFQALREILIPGDETDLNAFRAEFLDLTAEWRRRSANEFNESEAASRLKRSPTSRWMIGVMQAARRHGLRVPTHVLSLYRTLLTAESVASQLTSGVNLQSVGRGFFEALQRDEILRALDPKVFLASLTSLFYLIRDSPSQLEQLLPQLVDGRFSINATTAESPVTTRAQNRRTRLIVSAVVSIGIALLITGHALPTVAGFALEKILVAALVIVYLSILVQWLRLR